VNDRAVVMNSSIDITAAVREQSGEKEKEMTGFSLRRRC
jgi:hypothetical protein